jgi:formylglycine-generating enzyme required for sulfatase activity
VVGIDSFLIDAEPVSATAYCRFLNSVGEVSEKALADWLVPDPEDDRIEHMLVRNDGSEWSPVSGCDRWPMVLVSWYGATAYSLWANGRDWTRYKDEAPDAETLLPSEAQWEYAARGAERREFPWGDEPPPPDRLNAGRHEPGASYSVESLPLADVNAEQGMSPFGLHHAAGNVWQWCRDWYDPGFYGTPEARRPNPVNRTATGVRSERGGSWVGPAELCRSSFRRGRAPYARGRCLGFRCVGPVP